MALYYYKSVGLDGKKYAGMIDAATAVEAKEKLRRQQLLVIALDTKKKSSFLFSNRGNTELKGADLITFTTQLAQLLTAGVPLYESLIALEEQYREEKFHRIILSLCESIKGGSSLTAALRQFPGSFPSLYTAMVLAGESVGVLDKTLEKLSVLLSKQMKLKKQLTTALIYPVTLAGFSLVVITLLLTFVIPSLEALFADMQVNSVTAFVIGASHFVRGGWPYFVPLFFAALVSFVAFKRTKKGTRLISGWLLKAPLIGKVLVEAALARFTRTVGTLLEGGVSIIDALGIGRQVMQNPLLEEVIESAEKRIVEGSFLSAELKKSPLIPSLVPRMLAIGEEGGRAAAMCQKIADLYEDEVEKTLTRLVAVIQPATLLIMGVIVGVIMLGVLLPLTDVNAFLET